MKKNLFFSVLLLLLLTGCASLSAPFDRTDLWGSPAPADAATKTIIVTVNTRHVNLIGGDIVRFVVGSESFTWSFDGRYFPAAIDISKVSNGLLMHPLMAYVQSNPIYQLDGY